MPIRCCRDCKLRSLGCHNICETYKTEKEKHDQMKKTFRNEKGTYISNSERFSNGDFYYKKR